MFNKRKVLYSAMAVALMSGGGNVWAVAGLSLDHAGSDTSGSAPIIASEQINAKGNPSVKIPTTGEFSVNYELDSGIEENFNVTFTLSGGAVWGAALVSTSLKDNNAGSAITLVDGGGASDSSAMFLVTGGVESGNSLSLDFSISDNTGVLGTSGGEITLSVDLKVPFGDFPLETSVSASDKRVTLISSQDGVDVSFAAAAAGSSTIDVSQGSLLFLSNSGGNSTTASLGTVTAKNSGAVIISDLFTEWEFDPDGGGATGGLVVSSAPFSASITGGTGRVFVDAISGGTYDEGDSTTPKDLVAGDVTDTEAKWEFDAAQTKHFVTQCSAGCDIIIEADGSTQIQPATEVPVASAALSFSASGTKTTTGKLLHIKRNGSVCTLYNIPSAEAVDILSVRVSNMSNKEGLVLGSLRGLDGTAIFTNQTLIDALAPNATARIDAEALKTLAGGNTWTGRAVLTISSNIPNGNMEAYGLVRNKAGGPLMNLSTGASGSGCDN